MNLRWPLLALCALTGCASQAQLTPALEAQLRAMRDEQQRQSRQLQLLEQRISLAEDTVRQAGLVGNGRPVVRINDDGAPGAAAIPPVEPIPTALHSQGDDDDPPTDGAPRPVVRAAGREGMPATGPSTSVVVHGEGGQTTPVQVTPAPTPSTTPARPPRGREHPTPRGRVLAPSEQEFGSLGEGLAIPVTGNNGAAHSGTSSVRDPRATPAYEDALELARTGRCTEALAGFASFLSQWPDHPFGSNAHYWRGQCFFSEGNAQNAAREFEAVVANYPTSNKLPDALYALVRVHRELGNRDRARHFADRLLAEHGTSEVASRLRAEGNPP